MNTNQILVTKAGLSQLQKELADLQAKRPRLIDRLSMARSMGDLSENSDYHSAKDEVAFVDGRIAELEDLLKNAKVVEPTSSDVVDFGHSVTVQVNGNKAVFHIVGEWEANPTLKKISHSSPLGQALMGRRAGEKVEVAAPVGKVVYTVVSIE